MKLKKKNIGFFKNKKKTLFYWNGTTGTESKHSRQNLNGISGTCQDSERDEICFDLNCFLN
jgi:hypothetical protein